MPEMDDAPLGAHNGDSARDIWVRSRIAAFAHRNAFERYKEASEKGRRSETLCSIVGLIFVIVIFALSESIPDEVVYKSYILLSITVSSSLITAYALYLSHNSTMQQNESLGKHHETLEALYRVISQKARKLEVPSIDAAEATFIARHLNEQIEILIARGHPPTDADYDLAHKIKNKIVGHPDVDIGMSFKGFLNRFLRRGISSESNNKDNP